MKKIISVFCIIALVLAVCPLFAAADILEEELLGTVSQKYESNGNPGLISGGNGDLGGASYGAYQFASTFDLPLSFARWCVSSGEGAEVGKRLIAAYEQDGNAYGAQFNARWKAIAQEDSNGFYRLQRLYVREKYYVPAVNALKTDLDLDVSKYGIAFKNAVWSRTLQHGLGSYENITGFMGIMKRVEESLPKGLHASSEEELIVAIYAESGKVVEQGTNPMKALDEEGNLITNGSIIQKYGLEGKYMKYFSGNSAAVQAGVYLRLRVNEIKELLAMLENYGGYLGGNDYGTVTPVLSGTSLSLSFCDALRGWSDSDNTAISISTNQKKQGTGALLLQPKTAEAQLSATLSFHTVVNFTGFTTLSMYMYLSEQQMLQGSYVGVTFLKDKTTVYTGEWPLLSLGPGWHTVTFALPMTMETEWVDAMNIEVLGVSGDAFMVDGIQVKTDVPAKTLQSAIVKADALNCRTGPGTDCTLIGQYPENSRVTVMGQGVNGWYFCSGTDKDGQALLGWCSGEYLLISEYLPPTGDVSGDGTVDALDALLILRYAVGKITLTDSQLNCADLNFDLKINATDALEVLKKAVNKA